MAEKDREKAREGQTMGDARFAETVSAATRGESGHRLVDLREGEQPVAVAVHPAGRTIRGDRGRLVLGGARRITIRGDWGHRVGV